MSAPVFSTDRKLRQMAEGTELGGVRITTLLTPDATNGLECLYQVKFLCCGKLETITHRKLVMRHSQGLQACRSCSQRRRSPWTHATVTRALEMREGGMSCGKIGLALGVPEGTVTGWCETRSA